MSHNWHGKVWKEGKLENFGNGTAETRRAPENFGNGTADTRRAPENFGNGTADTRRENENLDYCEAAGRKLPADYCEAAGRKLPAPRVASLKSPFFLGFF